MAQYFAGDGTTIASFDMRSAADRAECASIMESLAFPTVRDAEWQVRLARERIEKRRGELRAELLRKPAAPGASRIQAMVDDMLYRQRWDEVRRLCWSLRGCRRALIEDLARVERRRVAIAVRNSGHNTAADIAADAARDDRRAA